jgi:hypothetical protein
LRLARAASKLIDALDLKLALKKATRTEHNPTLRSAGRKVQV